MPDELSGRQSLTDAIVEFRRQGGVPVRLPGSPRVTALPKAFEERVLGEFILELAGIAGIRPTQEMIARLVAEIQVDAQQRVERGESPALSDYTSWISRAFARPRDDVELAAPVRPEDPLRQPPTQPRPPSPTGGGGGGGGGAPAPAGPLPPVPAGSSGQTAKNHADQAKKLAVEAKGKAGAGRDQAMQQAVEAFNKGVEAYNQALAGLKEAAKKEAADKADRDALTHSTDQKAWAEASEKANKSEADRIKKEKELEKAKKALDEAERALDDMQKPSPKPEQGGRQPGARSGASPQNFQTGHGIYPGIPVDEYVPYQPIYDGPAPVAALAVDDCIKMIRDCAEVLARSAPPNSAIGVLAGIAEGLAAAAGATGTPCPCPCEDGVKEEQDEEDEEPEDHPDDEEDEADATQPGGGGGGVPPPKAQDPLQPTPDPTKKDGGNGGASPRGSGGTGAAPPEQAPPPPKEEPPPPPRTDPTKPDGGGPSTTAGGDTAGPPGTETKPRETPETAGAPETQPHPVSGPPTIARSPCDEKLIINTASPGDDTLNRAQEFTVTVNLPDNQFEGNQPPDTISIDFETESGETESLTLRWSGNRDRPARYVSNPISMEEGAEGGGTWQIFGLAWSRGDMGKMPTEDGEALTIKFGDCTKTVRVYNTWVQQGIAQYLTMIRAHDRFWRELAMQLETMLRQGGLDPKTEAQAKTILANAKQHIRFAEMATRYNNNTELLDTQKYAYLETIAGLMQGDLSGYDPRDDSVYLGNAKEYGERLTWDSISRGLGQATIGFYRSIAEGTIAGPLWTLFTGKDVMNQAITWDKRILAAYDVAGWVSLAGTGLKLSSLGKVQPPKAGGGTVPKTGPKPGVPDAPPPRLVARPGTTTPANARGARPGPATTPKAPSTTPRALEPVRTPASGPKPKRPGTNGTTPHTSPGNGAGHLNGTSRPRTGTNGTSVAHGNGAGVSAKPTGGSRLPEPTRAKNRLPADTPTEAKPRRLSEIDEPAAQPARQPVGATASSGGSTGATPAPRRGRAGSTVGRRGPQSGSGPPPPPRRPPPGGGGGRPPTGPPTSTGPGTPSSGPSPFRGRTGGRPTEGTLHGRTPEGTPFEAELGSPRVRTERGLPSTREGPAGRWADRELARRQSIRPRPDRPISGSRRRAVDAIRGERKPADALRKVFEHAEGQAVLEMRNRLPGRAWEAWVDINRRGGMCPDCLRELADLIPDGSTLHVRYRNVASTIETVTIRGQGWD